MPNLRLFLLMSLAFVGVLLWQAWQQDYAPAPSVVTTSSETVANPQIDAAEIPSDSSIPTVGEQPGTLAAPVTAPVATEGELIEVVTDVLHVVIDTQGGSVVRAELLAYPEVVEAPEDPVVLLNSASNQYFVAQSGLLSNSSTAPDHRALYSAKQSRYTLNGDSVEVDLTWSDAEITITKRFTFVRGEYAIGVKHVIANASGESWAASEYRQLQRVDVNAGQSAAFTDTARYSFMGPAVYDPENKYEKVEFADLAEEPIQVTSAGGWMAMVQHYFLTAWIPQAEQVTRYESTVLPPSANVPTRYLVRQISPSLSVAAGEELSTLPVTLYVGPKLQDHLEAIAPGLDLTVDYGILTPFSKILFWLLEHIHSLVGNWGWAIVLLTILIKAAFFKLSEAQYKSMARMRKLQPRIAAMRERYGDDKAKLNQSMMELYKKEKANPLGGCLPLLVQIPVFIALYWVLLESVELRQAPFILWINNLSAPDPYFILPAINGAAMFMTSKLSPAPGMDPLQQKIMMYMPLGFAIMFAFFPAGLVLYWSVNSVLSLAQQWFIIRRFEAAEAKS